MFLFSVVCVHVCMFSLCLSPLSGHWRGTPPSDEKPVSVVYSHRWHHRVDCSTPAYGEEPTESEEERKRSNNGGECSLHQHRKWKEGCLEEYGWRMKLIFHMEVECFAALSCGIWNYSTKLMSSFSLKSAVFIAHALINSFTHLLTWRGGKINDQKL